MRSDRIGDGEPKLEIGNRIEDSTVHHLIQAGTIEHLHVTNPQQPGSETVRSAAREVAGLIAPFLEERLADLYAGPWSHEWWLSAVNAQRVIAGYRRGQGLHDHRFCLAVFGYEEATNGWADDRWRRLARDLLELANQVAHDEPLSDQAVERAVAIAARFRSVHEAPAEGWNRKSHPYELPCVAEVGTRLSETSTGHDLLRRCVELVQEERWTQSKQAAAQERWLAAAQQWTAMAPGDSDARHSYAQALLATAEGEVRVERAERLLTFLNHQWPGGGRDPGALFYRAGALVDLHRMEEAAALAQEAVYADDSLKGAWALLAWTSTMALGDYQAGELAARRLLHDEPDNEWARYILSEALDGQGRRDEAAAVYGEA